MRAVICRVASAAVTVDNTTVGSIDRGLLVYLGVMIGDAQTDVDWMIRKLTTIRLFPDDAGKMNHSVTDIDGGLLLVSNFTLAARAKKGTRPSFTDAAPPELAEALFNQVVTACRETVTTETGQFGAHMLINQVCDGPITITLDTQA